MVWVVEEAGPVVGVVRGALLGPETTGPVPLVGVGVLCLGSRRPAGGCVLFRGPLTTSVQGVRVVV